MGGKPVLFCRLWWPRHLSLRPVNRMALIGWATNFSGSLDLIVATACSKEANSFCFSDSFTKVMLNNATNCLPSELQKRATLSMIGECTPSPERYSEDFSTIRHGEPIAHVAPNDANRLMNNHCLQEKPEFSRGGQSFLYIGNRRRKDSNKLMTGGEHVKSVFQNHHNQRNGFRAGIECTLDDLHLAAESADVWIDLLSQPANLKSTGVNWIPMMKTLKCQGSHYVPDIHIILYEQPKLSSHHFSIRPWNFVSMTSKAQDYITREHANCLTRPQWVSELEKQQEALDIDLVILQLNCAVAAEQAIEDILVSLDTSCKRLSLSSILSYLCRHLVAATIALPATVFYILIQAGSCTFSAWPFFIVNAVCAKLMKHTSHNLRIRCHQLTGWPVVLLWRGCSRDQPNIESAHRTALVRHSTWSAVIFDLFFGMLSGLLLLAYHASISQWVRCMVRSLTDDILRTGCIWLMGVPAGFKLNTELAGTLGLLSLNVIQVWSTLLYLLKPAFGPFLCVLAVTGMLLGVTVPAAMVVDVLFLATIHISTLHKIVAFLYSNQLQALAALWRLFRGRKRNYLRGRIDTYDYSVEQHVVGSLMFTPLLLLLPTTSVFYIFFTILYTSLSMLRFSLLILIALLHCFPYAQVAIWLVQPRKFPSGIWFETLFPGRSQQLIGLSNAKGSSNQRLSYPESSKPSAGKILVSVLGIKTANLGELLLPYLRQLGGGVTWSSCALFIYKIFSGERWSSSVELGTPTLPPWTSISARRFWWLCYDAVLASI